MYYIFCWALKHGLRHRSLGQQHASLNLLLLNCGAIAIQRELRAVKNCQFKWLIITINKIMEMYGGRYCELYVLYVANCLNKIF